MGCNYFLRTNICEHCNRYDERHIGKKSFGWRFAFQGYDDIRSCADWLRVAVVGQIYDEYGQHVSIEHFTNVVNATGLDHITELLNADARQTEHITRAMREGDDWHDDAGYSFSKMEFS